MTKSGQTKDYLLIQPQQTKIIPRSGETIANAIIRAGLSSNHPCGGQGRCGKCLIRVEGAAPALPAEQELLSPDKLEQGWRLSCLHPAQAGMTVHLNPLGMDNMRILETAAGPDPEPGADTGAEKYYLACDIGTTTVVVYLLHPQSGATVATASALNRQIAFGADVISRIYAIIEDESRLAAQRQAIIDTINQLITDVTDKAGIDRGQIGRLSIAGNTVMTHIFYGADPRSLGKSPFTPIFLAAPPGHAAEFGLGLSPQTPIELIPNLSAFVGGDIMAGIYYTGMHRDQELSLLLDIGTNNEMVLGCRDFIYACSAAAGPALEGAQISTGMRATEGAVEKFAYNEGGLAPHTIGDSPPRGLCGSGLIDLLSILVQQGVISVSGKFAAPEQVADNDLAARLRRSGKRKMEFIYCRAGEHGAKQDLVLTQKDVREAQLAKSAIKVGIDKLLAEAGATLPDIKRVYLAGAFGNYIDHSHAMRLGILPRVKDDAVCAVYNSAGLGVCRAMYDAQAKAEMERISALCQPLNLAAAEDFQQRFLEGLSFN